jgi:hypothetical protein
VENQNFTARSAELLLNRRDACSMAGRSQHGRVVAEKWLREELSGAPDTLVDFHTATDPRARK